MDRNRIQKLDDTVFGGFVMDQFRFQGFVVVDEAYSKIQAAFLVSLYGAVEEGNVRHPARDTAGAAEEQRRKRSGQGQP